jgi:nucleotide-binding universal stress UspA family protein
MMPWDNILLCVDSSQNSDRAVQYVARFVSHLPEVKICLLHVYPAPPPDYFTKNGSLEGYTARREQRGVKLLKRAEEILVGAGVDGTCISKVVAMAEGRSISQQVLAIRRQGNCGTVVTGKRGISKAEEFLFGSISNALARQSKDFTTWIVG